MKSKRVPITVKVKVYLIYILPAVLYGLDCITWTKNLSNRIEIFQNHIMRFITGHQLIDKVSISALRQLTSLPPLFDKIKIKTLKLYGHIKRSTCGLSKLCFEGLLEGKRNRGKPKQRLRDNILKWSSTTSWITVNQLCRDRDIWRRVSHVGSQSATEERSDS